VIRALTIVAMLLTARGASAQAGPEAVVAEGESEAPSELAEPGAVTLEVTAPEASEPETEAAEAITVPPEPSRRELSLEASLRVAALEFDAVSFLGSQRTILMGIFETYCAVELLIPPEEGFRTLDFVLGLGCLVGASTLLVMGIRRLLYPKEGVDSHERLVQFYRDRRAGHVELAAYEEALFDAARRDRRRRWVRFSLGVLELGAAATVAGLTGRDRIERTAGASIAIGTAIIAILGLVHAALRSPAERAAEQHRAVRAVATGW